MISINKESKTVTGIILVAGNSTRYGKGINKNLEQIDDKPVFLYSLNAFDNNKYIDNIIIAVKANEKEEIEKILKEDKFLKEVKIVIGGKTRKESVYNCIKEADSDIVIIHDGARPVIKQEYINNCIKNMNKYDGVTIGVKSKDTIKITDENNIVLNTTKREFTWNIQTPQCFKRKILLNMHNKYKDEKVTDDCELLEKDNYKIKILEGDYTNIKITTQEDFEIVKKFLK